MTFIREVPLEKVVQAMVNDLEQEGFTLIYKESTIEIWADATVSSN